MQFIYYTILPSRLASRFVTILGKKTRAKRQQSLKKDRNRSFSRFDTNLVKKRENCYRERGEKGALKRRSEKAMPIWPEKDRTELSRTTKHGLVLSHAVPFYQPHATRPHTSARNGQLTGVLPFELLLRVSDNGLGKIEEKLMSWGKLSTTKDLRARK
jgi:hypothetical protein